jgi:hypothetical protein
VQALFDSGRIFDLILLLLGLECAGLALLRALTGRGPALRDMLPTLLSGAFLLVAMRAAQADAGLPWIGASLLAALCAHLIDLSRRWNTS